MTGIKVIRRDSARDARTLSEIAAIVQSGRTDEAAARARAALDDGLVHPMLLNLRSYWHDGQGRTDAALADLRLAHRLDPGEPFVRSALGILLGRLGKWNEAIPLMQETLRQTPDAAACFNLGWAYEFTGELARARDCFEQAVARDPDFAEAHAHLASLAWRRADWQAAEDAGIRALARDPHNAVALSVLAATALARRDLPQTDELLARLGDTARLPTDQAALALTTLGDLRDAEGRTAEAFAAYAERNRRKFRDAAPQFDRPGNTATDYARWLADHFAALPAGWNGPAPPPDPRGGATGHVFLVGFPRSGTTLAENVLASHPDVVALDERDTLGEAARALLVTDDGLAWLAALTPDEIAEHRRVYWQRVAGYGAKVEGKLFLDKYPLSSLKLPLVKKLFPDAKILFALRDPRDVIFSCFRRAFALNGSMFELLDLERGARFYDAVMTLAAIYREKLGLPWHVLRYEVLVADFEGEMRAVCDFIGLSWDAQMRDFAEHAKARTIKTPSSTQVVRGLYREGAGQWRPYAQQLAPAIAILDPWIKHYGYE